MKLTMLLLSALICSCTYSGITNKNQRGGSGGTVRVIYRSAPTSDYEKKLLDQLHDKPHPELENNSQ